MFIRLSSVQLRYPAGSSGKCGVEGSGRSAALRLVSENYRAEEQGVAGILRKLRRGAIMVSPYGQV
jgi:hypothetical protein